MGLISIISIILLTIAAMELVAFLSHKYIMHGWGWAWHRDHHEGEHKRFERNDLYGVVGAVMSISFFALGSPMIMAEMAWEPASWIGLGILCYGIIYTLIHDGLVHHRYFKWVPRGGYAKRLVQAHKLHHATTGKEGGVSFSFVYARNPAKLKAELKAQQDAARIILNEGAP